MLAPVGSAGSPEVGITLCWHSLPHCLGEGCCLPVPRAWQFSARLAGGRWGIGNAPQGNEPDLFATGPRPAQECGWLAAAGGSHGDAEPGRLHSCLWHPVICTMFPLLLLLLATAHGLGESANASGLGWGSSLSPACGGPLRKGTRTLPGAWKCRAADAPPPFWVPPLLSLLSPSWVCWYGMGSSGGLAGVSLPGWWHGGVCLLFS